MATLAQQDAFTSGAGGSASMGDFSLVFSLIAATMILLFAGWLIISEFRAWSVNKIDLYEFLWATVRVLLVVIIFGFYIRP